MSRKLDLLGWYFQAVSTVAIALTASALELPLSQWAMLFAAAWVVSAYLTAWPYTRRFGGGMVDWLWIGSALALVVAVPLVPFFWCKASRTGTDLLVFTGCFALAGIAVVSLRAQGRHRHAQRDLPELAGEPRRAVEAVLARAGLKPVSVRVATLPTFNAQVHGFRKCIVVVDRRLSEAFTTEELSAVIAHEAGHIKYGGILPKLGAMTAVLTGASVLDVLGWAGGMRFLDLFAAVLLLRTITSQWLEFRCDRFAAALTSPGDVVRSLEKVLEDRPPAAVHLSMSLWYWYVPVSSHPPIATRSALLLGGGRRIIAAYLAVLLAASLGLVVLPLSAKAAEAASGIGLPAVVESLARYGPPSYILWCVIFSPARARAARRGVRVLLRGRVKKAYLEAHAALVDGKPDEALTIAEKALRRDPKNPWLQMARGQSLLWLGRLDEAAECLAAPVCNRTTRPTAIYLLGFTEVLREKPARAGELAESLVKEAPRNALAWLLLGIAASEAGKHEEAEASLARSCELKAQNAGALARRVVSALERGLIPGSTDAWMEAARASDPRWPGVLAASARWRLARGEAAQAREDMCAAIDELRKRGLLGWIPSYERDARRWGIWEAPPA